MATVKGSQQVMSSPNTPILTKGVVTPRNMQNVPANVTTDSSNSYKREDRDALIGDDLLTTIHQTKQLPTAHSYFDTEPSATSSFEHEHNMMNIVVIHPRLLSSKLLSLEDFASPMFNMNTIMDPTQDIYHPGWKTALALSLIHI